MLTDQHHREVQYALEFAMLAVVNQLPPHVLPPMTPSEVRQTLLEFLSYEIRRPIPVPRDWKPCLKLPQHMLETQTKPQLDKQIGQLRNLISTAIHAGSSNAHLTMARSYLVTAKIYLSRAHFEQARADRKRKMAEFEQMRDEWLARKRMDHKDDEGSVGKTVRKQRGLVEPVLKLS